MNQYRDRFQWLLKSIMAAMIVIMLAACRGEPRECRLQGEAIAAVGHAGCWLEADGQLLIVQQRNGKYSFPGGTSEPGETAQCTAHRETWEEAGVDVEVGQLKHRFDNGFYLYRCYAKKVALVSNDMREVKKVLWVDPATIPAEQWRFPAQREQAIEWLK